MANKQGSALSVFLITAILILSAPIVLSETSSSCSNLYCVSNPSHSITTLNVSYPHAKCFCVQDGVYTQVLDDVPEANGEIIHALDGWVLPGIIESHGHILQYGEMLESVSLYDADSMEEVRRRIVEFLDKHRGEGYGTREKWVRGIGWDQKFFGGIMPTAKELVVDPILSNLYIMLDLVDVHCVLTSQKVLDLLPNPLPKAPPGGVVVTEPGPGVFCDNAMDAIIYPIAPKPDVARKTRWFKTAMAELNKVGIIGAGDAGMRPEDVVILEDMAGKGQLSLRINVMLECAERNTYCPEEIKDLTLLERPRGISGSMLILGGVKLFADGALGSWGAALLAPYSDKPETSGTMLINETELTPVVSKWFKAGFQVNVHAIGDRANRAAIDAFEEVLGPNCNGCNDEKRLRIEHAQIIHPKDQFRLARLGIIPSIQPTHATSDMAYALDRLGSSRLKESAYRMATLFPPPNYRTAYPGPVLGSDFPVEPPNPFHGMFAAVARLSPVSLDSPAGKGGWYPQEKLSIEQALKGFTTNGAYGWFKEQEMGKIQVGMLADWVVIDRDIFADESGMSLVDIQVKETWVGGRRVYDSQGRDTILEGANDLAERINSWLLWLRYHTNGKRWWMARVGEEKSEL
ncbi:amidohydrolase family-domain-containing protein [Amylocarpus encephaloides]|uniref:Amidohydrolase family-domain-containing protein n=1 Tax=Amylocarpus encephaloides TaxID=45428 RepID=A0A9P7YBZ4_9HELO|nr:amidohydrolase family-domain-containing protein [Amylocarpus encephaloides]